MKANIPSNIENVGSDLKMKVHFENTYQNILSTNSKGLALPLTYMLMYILESWFQVAIEGLRAFPSRRSILTFK